MNRVLVVFVLSLLILGCGSKKKVVTKKPRAKKPKKEVVVLPKNNDKPSVEEDVHVVKTPIINSTTDYIAHYKDIAIREMKRSGIPASITLAQGILESGSGKGRLAVKANNHFGIKCHGWKGGKIYHDDDAKQECFRKYKNAERSFVDHSEFLVGRKRYAKLFNLKKTDYKGWAKELRKAGYATDKKYPQKLISLIERYKLYTYDHRVLDKSVSKAKAVKHIVVKGDTLYAIAKRYGTSVEALKKDNNLTSNSLSVGEVLVIKN